MKKFALLVYPEFSFQEVMNLSRLFRWEFGWINGWGAAIVIIMLIPNIIFSVRNPHLENKCENVIMNTIEQVGRYSSMILMIVPVLVWKFGFKNHSQRIKQYY